VNSVPEPKQLKTLALIGEYRITVLPIIGEANQLADIYVSENIVAARFRLDGAHIAIASIYDLTVCFRITFSILTV